MRSWSHILTWVLCVATVVLLAAGAMVTSTGSSLAVPDWPLAYGQLFPPMVGGILYEHGHRLIAGTVGLLTIAVMVWLWVYDPRRWVRWLGIAALLAVIFQGVLGGVTVLLLLPKAVSISHALMAQGFFLLTVTMVQATAPGWESLLARRGQGAAGRLPLFATLTLAALISELFLGAVVRHFGAGLAIPDFPLAFGGLVPPLTAYPIVIHFLHRVGALVVLGMVGVTLGVVMRHHGREAFLTGPAKVMGVLVVVQILLGGGVIWSHKSVEMTTLHLVNGALLIATTGVLALRSWIIVQAPGVSPASPVEVSV